ncbi:16S rRNA (cytidine(1402)-2'-O)-methyltransferase [Tissierella pigra]|uniref:Ribosomal RNA small subunit methyltransferase I n=1 Tax=Tissierella pigra TaxID=2607614 RepID=A0A6N7XFR1_9FIRM|nr:16S rRNA (cytidine(1402)-2'-O)-methyltransferase [Tissierella pigra]MBU5427991.1 16S rRNA (cytidine(1402)-2'-O)-methyltransferase [Tissierella pigra]MSU00556.1 16S rRNA (cytidine(1402)-2'-O)-methyltransferase [Tissierella pigra]
MESGKLYICPTPIGNLEDITFRTINILQEVDVIAAEDTRHTIKLLNHYDIKKPLTSYHEHNIKEKGITLIEKLKNGTNIALVSDAGMPGISDPGEVLVRQAIEEGIEVIVLPGATASITALVVSGLSTHKFTFEGFLSSKKNERVQELKKIKEYKYTTIIYESPHRILNLLEDMLSILGERKVSISRELTKKYEETFRGTIEEALEYFKASNIRGEFVLVLEGNKEEEAEKELDIESILKKYIEEGMTKKEAVKKVAHEYGVAKNEVYRISVKISEE